MWESQRLELGLEVGKGKGKLQSFRTFEIQELLLGRGFGGSWKDLYVPSVARETVVWRGSTRVLDQRWVQLWVGGDQLWVCLWVAPCWWRLVCGCGGSSQRCCE